MSPRLFLHRSSLDPSSACGTEVFHCWLIWTISWFGTGTATLFSHRFIMSCGSSCHVVPQRHGVSSQPGKITPIPHGFHGLARHPVVPPDGPLATAKRGSAQHTYSGARPASRSLGHPPPAGMSSRSDQLCVPGASFLPTVLPAAHGGRVGGLCCRQGCTCSSSPGPTSSSSFLGSPEPWQHVPSFHVSFPLRSFWTDASAHGWEALLELSHMGSVHWSPLERHLHVNMLKLRAVRMAVSFFDLRRLVLRVFRQQDAPVHAGRVSHPLLRPPPRVSVSATGPAGPCPPSSGVEGTHSPQRGRRCSQTGRPTEHGMDTSDLGVRACSPLGGSFVGGPDGVSGQPLPPQVGVRLPTPGGSGGGLSKFRLGRLWVLVSLPSYRDDSPAATSHPRLSGHRRGDCSVAATRDVVSDDAGSPAPPHDTVPVHGGGDRLARVGNLLTLDRSAFLQQVLSARYPPRVIDTLLAAFRPSSQRQHDLAWRLFQSWLPDHVVSLSRVQVLEFLQHLFDEVGLSPRTVLCYRAALKWPLQEAFRIDFGHDYFQRQATGLFHLRLPSAAPLPQWDLNEVLRFYDSVDVSSCPLRLAFLKALFLTALASGNRCVELAHFSRRATVDKGSSLNFGLKPRFLYKNQASGRTLPPISSMPVFSGNPALCPMVMVWTYMARTSTLPHQDFVLIHPSTSASLVAGRLNYWVVQAISAVNIRGAVIRAHDVRKFAYVFWASAHPFLGHYLTTCPSRLPAFVTTGSLV